MYGIMSEKIYCATYIEKGPLKLSTGASNKTMN